MLARAGETDPAQDIESLVTAAVGLREPQRPRALDIAGIRADRVRNSNGDFHGKRAVSTTEQDRR